MLKQCHVFQVCVVINNETVLDTTILDLADQWEETSCKLEEEQKCGSTATQEYDLLPFRNHFSYKVDFAYNDEVSISKSLNKVGHLFKRKDLNQSC